MTKDSYDLLLLDSFTKQKINNNFQKYFYNLRNFDSFFINSKSRCKVANLSDKVSAFSSEW